MPSFSALSRALLLAALTLLPFVCAIPTWDMFNSRASMGSLVPGATIVQAIGGGASDLPRYLTVAAAAGAHHTPL